MRLRGGGGGVLRRVVFVYCALFTVWSVSGRGGRRGSHAFSEGIGKEGYKNYSVIGSRASRLRGRGNDIPIRTVHTHSEHSADEKGGGCFRWGGGG